MKCRCEACGFEFDDEGSGELVFDNSARREHLSPKSMQLLAFLVWNAGKFRTRKEIFEALWRDDPEATDDSVRVRMTHVRGAIEEDSRHPTRLVSRRGFGYFVDPSFPEDLQDHPDSIIFGDFVYNSDYRRIFRFVWENMGKIDAHGEEAVVFTIVEELEMAWNTWLLLSYLAKNLGGKCQRENLMKAVWGEEVSANLFKQEVNALRDLLGKKRIVTIGGKGGKPATAFRLVP